MGTKITKKRRIIPIILVLLLVLPSALAQNCSWTCSEWSICYASKQERICDNFNDCDSESPETLQDCNFLNMARDNTKDSISTIKEWIIDLFELIKSKFLNI